MICIGIGWAANGNVQPITVNGATPPAASGPTASAQTTPSRADVSPSSLRGVLDRYCITCHSEQRRTGGVALETISVDHVGDSAELWEKVAQKLRSGTMPPPGMPRPDENTYDSLASWLETALDRAAAAKPNPGRPAIHRLNRAEYTNAIRDLLALEIDGRSLLPADDSSYGFDNSADYLTVSQSLLERYVSAAQKISRLAVGDPTLTSVAEIYRISRLTRQDGRMSEDLPFGSRGGMAIRHHFPLDGEYEVRVRLQRSGRGVIYGLEEPNQIDVWLDGERVKEFAIDMLPPDDRPEQQLQFDGPGRFEADTGLRVRFSAKAGTRVVGITFLKRTLAIEGLGPARLPVENFENLGVVPMAISTVEIRGPDRREAGPGDTPSRQRIFVCRPAGGKADEACAKTILRTLARRAYRRPVTESDVQTLMSFYRVARRTGGFDTGIQAALERLLVDLEFLFRIERDPSGLPSGSGYRLSDVELASRLSFLLWSSIPDDELLRVAEHGQLSDPAVLARQVGRMLGDARSAALVNNFAAQWLHLRNMEAVRPDRNAFPEFDDNLRAMFERETVLFLESQLREDRSVLDLLTADYTFLNERLARHYGISGVYGSQFRRVTFTDDRRAGLLGQGSILTVTSYANRTSPVQRGKWLLENILGAPPPPPPANVPPLKEKDEGGSVQALSVRERMEQHRKNPACASCHARIDPLGFALENFDAIGKWRAMSEAHTPIDTSASLPDGTTFQGPAELRRMLVSRREEFARTVTTKLLTYALGRHVNFYDVPTVRLIVREAAPDYRWSSIILGIARSTPFQMRSSEP